MGANVMVILMFILVVILLIGVMLALNEGDD